MLSESFGSYAGRCWFISEIEELGLYFGNAFQTDRICILISVCTAIVTDVFQGSMRIFTKKLPHPDLVSGLNRVLDRFISPEGI